jgi:hypothetical protein
MKSLSQYYSYFHTAGNHAQVRNCYEYIYAATNKHWTDTQTYSKEIAQRSQVTVAVIFI